MRWLGLTVALLALVSAALAANYCSASLCPSGRKHIACDNSGKFVPTCPSNAVMVNMSPLVKTIVNVHNKYRNQIAGGSLKRYKPAKRMATMQWDSELASIAAFNVKQCQMKHDQCRNTVRFKMAGQNLAEIAYSGARNRLTDDSLVREMLDLWFDEHKVARMAYIDRYPDNYSGPAIGHFTVFVADRNIRVGCAASRYTNNKGNNFLLACNYATTNIIGREIYAAGPAGSGCKKGRNTVYKNLCAPTETYSGL